MSATERVIEFITDLDYASIPAEAREAARRAVLDTTACILIGSRDPLADIAYRWVEDEQAAPIASVIGTGLRTSPANAAWANGAAGHALDYDDSVSTMGGHPSVPLLAALLPAAEVEGVHATGADLIDAFLVGFEVESKVGRGMGRSHYQRGFHNTTTLGALGSTAACARLWRLDARQASHALGIAASLASGIRANFGSMTKPMGAGNAARAGVVAASLAKKGFTGGEAVLDGRIGFIRNFTPEDDADESLVTGFGTHWDAVDPGIWVKKYACSFASHSAIDAALALAIDHNLRAEDVERIEVHIPPGSGGMGHAPGRGPDEVYVAYLVNNRPTTGIEGRFSLEYPIAAAILDHQIRLSTFDDEAVVRPEAQALIRKVSVVRDETRPAEAPESRYQTVGIHCHDGRQLTLTVREPRGAPSQPLAWDEIVDKYRDCASRVLSEGQIERSLAMLSDLDHLGDVRELLTQLQVH